MRLAVFIKENQQKIIGEWEEFARDLIPFANDMTPLALRNHVKEILAFIVDDMESPQTGKEQVEKSRGEGKQKNERKPSAAETHAALRLAGGFNLDQMVSEYRALRASVIKLWREGKKEANDDDLRDLIRFNETIDQALTESISHYAKKLGASKDLFLGILTHDLRNPLGAILGAAELMPRIGPLNERQNVLASQITESGNRLNEIVSHLLDITKARFGSGLPVVRSRMDIGFVARKLVDEMRTMHPNRKFVLEVSGDTEGDWDKARIAQVFSNLLGNAVQYSFTGTPITVTLTGRPDDVVLTVHNEGIPIPEDKIPRIFDSLIRAVAENGQGRDGSANLGLGLYITKEIVTAHGGTLHVESSEMGGTTFTASFPRRADVGQEKNNVPDLAARPDNARSGESEKRLH
ncbi:MAG TPA: HAMP domain-containing sensor histidine kinase [Patescibacteria group bacterium]|jgi:hypothetical protein|nr:HAMP domain-containing sensor histidine kinase [Patescibacteria group bacterium]